MRHEFVVVRDYITPPINAFWMWDPDGEVIRWVDGPTIAFRAELAELLEMNVELGLPPLTGIVLLLAACRDSWSTDPPQIEHLAEMMLDFEHLRYTRRWSTADIERDPLEQHLLEPLNRIHALPREVRRQLRTRAALIEVLLELNPRRTTAAEAELIIEAFRVGIPSSWLQPGEGATQMRRTLTAGRQLKAFFARVREFDFEAFLLRLETGLERDILPAEIDVPLGTRVRRLLSQLADDDLLPGLVRLTQSIMAAINLPRPLEQPDDLPHGGVSDIANRGPLDRLLLSELANDDDVLTVRIATNEALYMRRETSSQTPHRHRVVLVDAGLRLWGVPRVFATSVALALAAQTHTGTAFTAYRPDGFKLIPVDLATREGVIAHLSALVPDAHPGDALLQLSEDLEPLTDETEVILITGEDVLADPDFQRNLVDSEVDVRFVASVSRSGRFHLRERTPHGTTTLCEATFDVEELQAPSARPSDPLMEPDATVELPAIFGIKPFPLRLPAELRAEQAWYDERLGLFAVTDDYRLLWQDDPDIWPLQIGESLPCARVHWVESRVHDLRLRFVTGNLDKSELWLNVIDLQERNVSVFRLDIAAEPILGGTLWLQSQLLFVIHPDNVEIFALSDGSRLTAVRPPSGCRWVSGRFFRGTHRWCALSYDGVVATFEDVVNYGQYADLGTLTAVFDVEGVQGPVGLSGQDGRLYLTAERKVVRLRRPLTEPVRVLEVSNDGRRIWVEYGPDTAKQQALIDSSTRDVQSVKELEGIFSFRQLHHAGMRFYNSMECEGMRCAHRFSAISADRELALFEQGCSRRAMKFDSNGLRFVPIPFQPHEFGPPAIREFIELPAPPGIRYTLRAAEWPDGSRAILDSRGLLHLKSSDRRVPEVTMVLSDLEVSGWCSDGRVWGHELYLGEQKPVPVWEIWHEVIQPFMLRVQP